MISVIVPVLDEAHTMPAFLEQFRPMPPGCELIAVDGGSSDETCALVGDEARLVRTGKGRGKQINAGATAARGDILLVLHADTFLPPGGLDLIRGAMADPNVLGGRFKVALDESGWIYRWIERGINWRDSVSGGFTGDQAIFVRRDVFERLGGCSEIPLLEDVDLARRLKRAGKLVSLVPPVKTSARRWRQCGPIRTIARMWVIKGLFLAGVSPWRLAGMYPDVR